MAFTAGSDAEEACAEDEVVLQHLHISGVAPVLSELEGGQEDDYLRLTLQMGEGTLLAAVALRAQPATKAIACRCCC